MKNLFTTKKVSPAGKLNTGDIDKLIKNFFLFTAPLFAIFFGQLAMGVEPRKAAWIVIFALYGILADFFKKLSDSK